MLDQHRNPSESLCCSVRPLVQHRNSNFAKSTCSKRFYQLFSRKIRFFLCFSKGNLRCAPGSMPMAVCRRYKDSFRKTKEKIIFFAKILDKTSCYRLISRNSSSYVLRVTVPSSTAILKGSYADRATIVDPGPVVVEYLEVSYSYY